MYSKLYKILEEKGRVKTAMFVTGPDFGKKCIQQPGEGFVEPEKDEQAQIWKGLEKEIENVKETSLLQVGEQELFVECYEKNPHLVIFGGGHVSQPTAHLGKMLGFHVTVMDDRADFVNRERFADADELICGDFQELDKVLPVYENSYYVILTRGHVGDAQCLRQVLNRPYSYVGMIGSKNKVRMTRDTLLEEGYSEETLDEVYAPIGLSIGGQLPEEIAVSIMAQIIQVKNRYCHSYCDERIEEKVRSGSHGVMMTIAEKRGSAPRGVGSKMFVTKSGKTIGSIGGGNAEFEAVKHCMQLLQEDCSLREIREYDLEANGKDSVGMICGGHVTVVFERV